MSTSLTTTTAEAPAPPPTLPLPLPTKSVIIHPLVLLSIQDHAARAAKGTKKRVVGILLGQDNGQTVNCANSFAVPFEEDEKDLRTWFLDHDYVESMNEMFKKVNAREKLIGWYHTGPRLRSSDLEINQVIKRYTPKPIMVIVDVRPDQERVGNGEDGGIPTEAFLGVEEIREDGLSTSFTFSHLPSSISASEAEEIGVEHLLRDVKSLSSSLSLSSRVSSQLASLKGLKSRLEEIREYLELVVKGERESSQQVLGLLQDVFNLLPGLEGAERGGESLGVGVGVNGGEGIEGTGGGTTTTGGKRPFTVATNDQLLVMYLSSLIRAVIALHNLVLNKQAASLEGQAGEEEEGGGVEGGVEEKKEEKSDKEKAKEYFTGGEDGKGGGAGEKKKEKDEGKGRGA